MALGTWPLLPSCPGPGKHSPAGSETAGKMQASASPASSPSARSPPLPIVWPLDLSLVPEAQGKSSLNPELPLAPQEVAMKLDREGEHKRPSQASLSSSLKSPDPTAHRGPYLGGVTDPANVSEDGIRAHGHVLQNHLKPQSHHSGQPAHQGWVHPTRHATLRAESSLGTQHLQPAFEIYQRVKDGSSEQKNKTRTAG